MRRGPWLCLAAALAGLLGYVGWLRPADSFGRFHDDTIFFTSARALAEGAGYVLPSAPESPAQRKYPVLYPWLLSWVWRWHPGFPDNLGAATWLTTGFGCAYLTAAFLLLRRLGGLGEWAAVGGVILTAFHAFFLLLCGSVMSDVPFLALALWAAVAADRAMEAGAGKGRMLAALAGVLASLSLLTRTVGLAVVAGVVTAALFRRRYRLAAWMAAGVGPCLLAAIPRGGAVAPSGPPGWVQTWAYYHSYREAWRLSIPNMDALRAMLSENLRDLLTTPSSLVLFPPLGGEGSYAGVLLSVTLTFGIAAGVLRLGRDGGWGAIHFIFPLYAAAAMLWNYAIMDRFLLLFLPVFYAGAWREATHLAGMVRRSLEPRRPLADRVVAVALGLALAGVAGWSARHYLGGLRPQLRSLGSQRAALLEEKKQAYDWVRRHTDAAERFVACEDAALYLYTGRQALWPMAFTTGAFYLRDGAMVAGQVNHFEDVARHIGARYWLSAEGDYWLEGRDPAVAAKLAQWGVRFPVLFRSSGGRVRIHDLSSLRELSRSPRPGA